MGVVEDEKFLDFTMSDSAPLEVLIGEHNDNEKVVGEDAFAPWVGVNCEVHPSDEIFRFFYHHPSSSNPLRDYFADGWRTLYELMAVLEEVGKPLYECESMLEFASGYGRLTRHLANFPGAHKVTVSDVMPGSVEFAKSRFGVNGFMSDSDPKNVRFPQQFELIFVLSLFSHLPKNTWRAWLEILYQHVQPGGCLLFSTHGAGFAEKNDVSLDSDGFFFVPTSESSHLQGCDYGTSVTASKFVAAAIASLSDAELLLHRQDHFWAGQDVWILQKSGGLSQRVRSWIKRRFQ
jgi:SAM-dependent methyltransferase